MAEKKFFVDVNLQGNTINNLKADTLDITSNLASANTKRIVYWSGQYYYSDGTSWIALGGSGNLPTGGATGDILAKASGTDYDVEWISNYTSTVQHEVKAGVALTKGQAVYVSSANGTNMIVSKASNASESTSSKTMGLVASSAALNEFIFVITEGLLTGTGGAPLDTSTATAGDPVWLGTNGNLIFGLANKPVAPAHLVFLGIVTRSNANVGEIFVKIQNGFELGELHNVDALNASNNDGLFYNTSTSLWEHKSIATVLGYTPVGGTGTTNYLSKFTASGTIGNSSVFETDGNVGIGTITPSASLHINNIGTGNSFLVEDATNPDVTPFVVDASGNVGAGILIPTRKLDINGVSRFRNFIGIDNSDSTVRRIFFTNGDDLNTYASGEIRSSELHLYNSATKVLSVINNNIGIGTITPGSKLEVNGDVKVSTIANATTDTDKFLVSDSGVIKYRTGSEVLSDIGGVGGSGTANFISKFTASGTIGNSLIQDNGTGIGINIAPQVGSRVYIGAGNLTGLYSSASTPGKNAVYGSSIGDDAGNRIAAFFEAYPSDTPINTNIYIGGRFFADGPFAYAVQLQDGTQGMDKFLKSVTSDGKANWANITVADTGLTLTTTGTSGAATLVGNTLNIPTYESSLIPKISGNEIWRGSTFRNNSTTIDTTSGLTLSTTGTNTARSVSTTSYASRGIRMGVTATIVATGRYSGMRGASLLWYVTGGFLYTGEFNISDTAFATGTHNFWGLASSTSDLVIGDVGNSQPSALLNIIAFTNDSGDANLQIMHNDASGTATKTDLGASFPSNRTAGAAITTIYSCFLYNAPNSSNVIYRIVNKETGAVAQGTLSTNLPASTVGLNFFGARTMGTSGGGITNSGQFDVYRLGVYSL